MLSVIIKRLSFLACNSSADARIGFYLLLLHLSGEIVISLVHLSATRAATNNKDESEREFAG